MRSDKILQNQNINKSDNLSLNYSKFISNFLFLFLCETSHVPPSSPSPGDVDLSKIESTLDEDVSTQVSAFQDICSFKKKILKKIFAIYPHVKINKQLCPHPIPGDHYINLLEEFVDQVQCCLIKKKFLSDILIKGTNFLKLDNQQKTQKQF